MHCNKQIVKIVSLSFYADFYENVIVIKLFWLPHINEILGIFFGDKFKVFLSIYMFLFTNFYHRTKCKNHNFLDTLIVIIPYHKSV